MKKFMVLLMVLGFAVYAACPSLAAAEEKNVELALITEDGIVLDLAGEVTIMKAEKWMDVEAGLVVSEGDTIKTGEASWAEVGFEIGYGNENVIRIGSSSTVKFTTVIPVQLNLLKGELRSLVQGLSGDTAFEVRTPTAVCGARGTGWDTTTDGTEVIVDAYENEVYFYPLTEGAVDPIIKAGKRGFMKDPTKPIEIKDLPSGKMNAWNKWKDAMSKRTGIKVGVHGKVKKIKNTQMTLEQAMKDKERMLKPKDKENLEGRLNKKSSSHPSNDLYDTQD